MIAGFTGTQDGMTGIQLETLLKEIRKVKALPEVAHHGNCVGSDSTFHDLIREYFPQCWIIIHPPSNSSKRACRNGDTILMPKSYLARDFDIAKACDVLYATPKGPEQMRGSGTWATIRYARKLKKEIIIIYPNGTVKYECDRDF